MNLEKEGVLRVSVIIPVRNEARCLTRCLRSILANNFPKDGLEILVVDGMSNDGTREIAGSFKGEQTKIQIIDNPERIVPTALNRGLRQAQGDIIIRIDGHGEIAPDFIRKSVETLQKVREAGCVGGLIEPKGESLMGQVIALAQGSLFGGGGGTWYRSRKAGFVDTVSNAAYRRSVFEKIGFFDETLVRDQDDEFNYRLRQAGYKIYYNPEIQWIYYTRRSLSQLAKQYFQYGFWKVRVLAKRPLMMRPRQFIPPLFVATILILAAGSTVFRPAQFAMKFLFGMYLTSSLIAAWVLGKRMGWKFVLALPLAFGAMHLGYGLGFWAGAIYFGLMRKE